MVRRMKKYCVGYYYRRYGFGIFSEGILENEEETGLWPMPIGRMWQKMREAAKNELWMPMRIGGIQGWFNDTRIERSSVPEWMHFWELADEDSNGEPCWYRNSILGNFYGTFLTTGILPVYDEEWEAGNIREGEWEIDWGKAITFDVVISRERGRAAL